jgi:hypothetical protein
VCNVWRYEKVEMRLTKENRDLKENYKKNCNPERVP